MELTEAYVMDKEELKNRIAVEQACLDGKTIEYSTREGKAWRVAIDPTFSWTRFSYRVKPEQLEIEVWYDPKHAVMFECNTFSEPRNWINLGFVKKKFKEVV